MSGGDWSPSGRGAALSPQGGEIGARGEGGVVLAALLRGGGERALADELDRAGVAPREAAEAVAKAFAASAGQAGG